MSVLNFDKNSLGNLEYSLQREMLATNRAGGYMSTTIVCCNTRKYHGLMVCPIDERDEKNYVLLSSLDETVIQHDQTFNLAIHRFPGQYDPRGHKYITDFDYTPCPTITYRVGGVILRKEMLWIHAHTQLLIRYTLVEAHSATKLRLRPFLAFRDAHTVTSANMFANGHSYEVPGGVRNRLYDNFPWLYMQTGKRCEFVAAPDWYYNFEYLEEQKRGYPFTEDLLSTGYFEADIAKGESVVFSCSLEEADPERIADVFQCEIARRTNKTDFLSCLKHSARQFLVRHANRTEVVAGYPWFGRWGRDTFIALPGITLTQWGEESCRDVLDTMVSEMKGGLFPNMGTAYNSVDAPLWFFRTVQQFEKHTGRDDVWKKYGKAMKSIIEAYRKGMGDGAVAMHENGLIWASQPGHALTWMDSVVEGVAVTPRDGYQVEINALWYNALRYMAELHTTHGSKGSAAELEELAEKTRASFLEKFWTAGKNSLADFVNHEEVNTFIRPNQIVACSLPYIMLSQEQVLGVISVVRQHLLTAKGLRTLSPLNPLYEGRYGGDQPTRDRQYHQGTVWPWLLEHYVKACFDVYGRDFLGDAEEILEGFDDDISTYGIGSIAEIYDGDPPHTPNGCISQAWSVGAILRINEMINDHKNDRG